MSLLAASLPALQTAAWGALGLVAVLAMLAIASPKCFAQLAQRSGKWVDTSKLFAVLDRRVDIDSHVLRYSRLFGAAVLAAVLVLGYTLWLRQCAIVVAGP